MGPQSTQLGACTHSVSSAFRMGCIFGMLVTQKLTKGYVPTKHIFLIARRRVTQCQFHKDYRKNISCITNFEHL